MSQYIIQIVNCVLVYSKHNLWNVGWDNCINGLWCPHDNKNIIIWYLLCSTILNSRTFVTAHFAWLIACIITYLHIICNYYHTTSIKNKVFMLWRDSTSNVHASIRIWNLWCEYTRFEIYEVVVWLYIMGLSIFIFFCLIKCVYCPKPLGLLA